MCVHDLQPTKYAKFISSLSQTLTPKPHLSFDDNGRDVASGHSKGIGHLMPMDGRRLLKGRLSNFLILNSLGVLQ